MQPNYSSPTPRNFSTHVHGRPRRPRPVARSVASLSLLIALCAGSLARTHACPPEPLADRAGAQPAAADSPARQPVVSIALLLDTSNSMDGLIGQAKAQLWAVVNRFRACSRDGVAPQLRIALYEYGNTNIPDSQAHVRMVSPFSTDLDGLSEKLFGLQTSGGNEYCGAVIDRAVRELSWGQCEGDLNMIFIAGNEPFTQGSVPYSEAIAAGVRGKIRINTIHCGTYQEGVDGKWRDGATLGRGAYSVINQGMDVRHIQTPYDDEITRLGREVNETYLAFGSTGEAKAARQTSVDQSSAALPGAAGSAGSVERAIAKNSSHYSNAEWDLIDAIDKRGVKLETLEVAELPASLRSLTREEQVVIVDRKRERRREINRRVAELQVQREAFVRERRQEEGKAGEAQTLGDALLRAIEQQATEEGWTFGR